MPRACPTPEELTAFSLGRLPEESLQAICAHLEQCPACEAASRALDDATDPLISACRGLAAGRDAPPRRLGDYKVLAEVGRGGMGVVYKAHDLKLNRVVALKMLLAGEFADPAERQRFKAEAVAVARLQHPNIVPLLESGELDAGDGGLTRPYFTLEFVAGGSLAAHAAGRLQPPQQVAAWLEPLARAAHYRSE